MSLTLRGRYYMMSIRADLGAGSRQIQLSTRCTDKTAAADVERKVRRLIECRRGSEPPTADLMEWLSRMPVALRQKLADHGIVDPERAASADALMRHVEDYLAASRHQDQAEQHVKNKEAQLKKLIDATNARRLLDLTADRVQQHLQRLKRDGRSNRTVNQHLCTAKSFLNWCVRQRRLHANPLASLTRLNEQKDRRLERRPFTRDELRRLLDATPPERRVIYLLLALTGLRRGEMKQIRISDIDLDARTLTVRPEIAKAGESAVLPLHDEAVTALRQHLAMAENRSDLLFPVFPRLDTFYRDLARAKIPRWDDQGKQLDMHAFRTTFVTELVRTGTPLPTAQKLTRHRTLDVLVSHYAKMNTDDAKRAIAAVPGVAVAEEANRGQHRLDDQEIVNISAPAGSPSLASTGATRPVVGDSAELPEDEIELAEPPQLRYIAGPSSDQRDPAPTGRKNAYNALNDKDLRAISSVG